MLIAVSVLDQPWATSLWSLVYELGFLTEGHREARGTNSGITVIEMALCSAHCAVTAYPKPREAGATDPILQVKRLKLRGVSDLLKVALWQWAGTGVGDSQAYALSAPPSK